MQKRISAFKVWFCRVFVLIVVCCHSPAVGMCIRKWVARGRGDQTALGLESQNSPCRSQGGWWFQPNSLAKRPTALMQSWPGAWEAECGCLWKPWPVLPEHCTTDRNLLLWSMVWTSPA